MHRKAPRPLERSTPPFGCVHQVLTHFLHANPVRQIYKDCLNFEQRSEEPRTNNAAHLWNMCHVAIERGLKRVDEVEAQVFRWRYLTVYAPDEEHPDQARRMASRERQNYAKSYIMSAIAERLGITKRTAYRWLNEALEAVDFECYNMRLTQKLQDQYGKD